MIDYIKINLTIIRLKEINFFLFFFYIFIFIIII